MYLIDDVLVSEEVFSQHFTCNLDACKGACCWEGDFGAPLEDAELQVLDEIRETLRPYLTKAGNDVIDQEGSYVYYKGPNLHGTPLIEDAACAYLTFDDNGIGQCGIEKAHKDGVVDFQKPVSCQLYPLRHTVEEALSFQALNFEEWEICSPACTLGQSLKMPAYKFVKDALIRKFGPEFYESLEQIENDKILQ